jgi:hypothetical protein
MTPSSTSDPLAALWRSAPTRDPKDLLEDVQRQGRLHQRLNRSVWAILIAIAVLLVLEEATGGIASHGILSGLWILGLAAGAAWNWRARCNRTDALTLDTSSLLEAMISRAKSDLLVARCLYAGVPFGAAVGYFVAGLVSPGVAPLAKNAYLHMMQLGTGIAALVVMMCLGFILARSRSLQVKDLSNKLRLIKADL